ncbi:hypothetical protein [Nodularia chucula]|uniref:hypothetical protein n=1 Tax=Nodularia chucula TaxID=3093667 RepID=UPI0039C75193
MNNRITGLLLIIRALTPLIILFIIIFNGYLIIHDLKQHLNKEMELVINSINNSKASLASVQGGIADITSSFVDVSKSLSSALQPINNAFNKISESISVLNINLGINLKFNNIFNPLFTPLDNVKEGVNTLSESIDGIIQPMKESVSILQNDLIKWIQSMLVLVMVIFLLVLNYFILPLKADIEKGINLLFNRSEIDK